MRSYVEGKHNLLYAMQSLEAILSPWQGILKLQVLAKGQNYTVHENKQLKYTRYTYRLATVIQILKRWIQMWSIVDEKFGTKWAAGESLKSYGRPCRWQLQGESADHHTVFWHHMLCEQTQWWMSEGKWHPIQGGAHRTDRCAMLLSEHLHPQSLSNYLVYSQHKVFSPTFSPDLTHYWGKAGFARLAVVSNQL